MKINISISTDQQLLAASVVTKGDRVIVNEGSAKEPIFKVGTVTKVEDKIVTITSDDGFNKTYTIIRPNIGILGFAKTKTKNVEGIEEKDLPKWLSKKVLRAKYKIGPSKGEDFLLKHQALSRKE